MANQEASRRDPVLEETIAHIQNLSTERADAQNQARRLLCYLDANQREEWLSSMTPDTIERLGWLIEDLATETPID